MIDPRYPPTATLAERLVLGSSCAATLVLGLLEWYLAAGVAFLPGLGAIVVQQLRESHARRAALERLKRELPAMTSSERQLAVTRFGDRFPDLLSRRNLRKHVALLEHDRSAESGAEER
jgi:hypothetical protein